jgi:hypothetical protein
MAIQTTNQPEEIIAGTNPSGKLAGSSNDSTCPAHLENRRLGRIDTRQGTKPTGDVVPNPGYPQPPNSPPSAGDNFPIVNLPDGRTVVGYPGSLNHDGSAIIAPDVLVQGMNNYPYRTWQGNQGNCVPRAFETQTGIYNPYLNKTMHGDENQVFVGNRAFIQKLKGENHKRGEVVIYDYPGGSKHAGVATGFDEKGRLIVTTSHQSRPHDVLDPGKWNSAWTEQKK